MFGTAELRKERSGHSHGDFGSFRLWVKDGPLIYGAATRAYRIDEINPVERGYFYSAYSHILLTIENYRPKAVFEAMGDVNRWWGDHEKPPVKVVRLKVRAGKGEMVLSHEVYRELKVTRFYGFDLSAGWMEVKDFVEAQCRLLQTFRQWLHFGFGALPPQVGETGLKLFLERCRPHVG